MLFYWRMLYCIDFILFYIAVSNIGVTYINKFGNSLNSLHTANSYSSLIHLNFRELIAVDMHRINLKEKLCFLPVHKSKFQSLSWWPWASYLGLMIASLLKSMSEATTSTPFFRIVSEFCQKVHKCIPISTRNFGNSTDQAYMIAISSFVIIEHYLTSNIPRCLRQ